MLATVLVLVLAAPVPKGPPTTAEKLVGSWVLTLNRGAAVANRYVATFGKDGVMTLAVGEGDKPTKYTGTYTVKDDTVEYEIVNENGFKKTDKLKVHKLDDDRLKVTDPEGIEEEFKRVEK
jgi:uncharacterized protein (TIGR03066 family)